jgi:hypothetical protein
MCFDLVYFAGVDDVKEWEKEWHPVWRFVGKHARFTAQVVNAAEKFLRATFGVQDHEPIPQV